MISACHSAILRRLRRFHDDQDGVSAVEFAMLLPLMITLYLGSIEVTQAISADRKMTLVAGTIGDLVAQASCVTDANIDEIFVAGEKVLVPLESTILKAVVTSVKIDANKVATVSWSKVYHGADVRSGNVTTFIPEALRNSAGSVIWAEAYYKYTPTIGKVIAPSGIELSEKIFLKPRLINSVDGIPNKSSC